jgi:gliding motility-associated-like protein
MELNSTQLRSLYLITRSLLLFLTLSFLSNSSLYAQTKIFANTATVISDHVDNANSATTDNNDFATVRSSGTLFNYYEGELRLTYANNVPANRTTFVKIGYDQALLDALLGGNLGNALSKVLGAIVLGNHYFTVKALSPTGTVVTSASSNDSFSSADVKLITDGSGNYYLAITPTVAYRSIAIRDITRGLIAGTNDIKVYNAFYVPSAGDCDGPFATDYEGSGGTLSLLGLGGAGVSNIHQAIDGDPGTASKMNLGLVTLAGTISQNVYFHAPSKPDEEFNIRLKVAPDLLNLGLLSNLKVEAFNGNNLVYTAGNVSALLTLDLLGLLNGGSAVNIPFSPNTPFDRVKITLSSLLNVAVAQSIDVFEVTRSAARPRFDAPISNTLFACYNGSVSLKATTNATNELRWYDSIDGGVSLARKAYNEGFDVTGLTATKTYYVAARTIGCTSESVRVPVVVTVNPEILFPNTVLTNGMVGIAYSKQLGTATGGVGPYVFSVPTANTLPPGVTISSSGLIAGVPAQVGTYNFTVEVKDSKGCTVLQNKTIIVRDVITFSGQNLPDGVVGTSYPSQIVPVATGGAGGFTYTVSNLPPGLTFDDDTRTISGTPTTIGTYNVSVTVTDSEGNSTTAIFPIRVKDPLVLSSAVLADGTVGVSYPTQTIPPAQGGVIPYTYTVTNLPAGLVFDPDTRQITGTPLVAGNYTVTVTATDGSGTAISTDYIIKVVNPLMLPSKLLADGTAGVAYSGETLPTATGGVGPYTYVAQNVPAEIVFDAANNNALVGTPNNAGTYSIILTVTDSEGRTATNYYELKINGALALPGQALSSGTVNLPYSAQTLPEVVGGVGPYVYQLSGMPAGMSFNAVTRVISGTPTTGGNFNLTLTVTDSNGNTVNANYQLRVDVRAPQVIPVVICVGSTATMTVLSPEANVTYNWYAAQGSTPLATANSGVYISSAINASTSFYVEAVSGSATSARVQVTVTANPLANAPTIITNNPSVNVNQSATLRAIAETNATVNWYGQATGGTRLAIGEDFTTPALTANTTYYVEAVTASGCASSVRIPVQVNVLSSANACNVANAQTSGINSILCVACGISNPTFSVDANKDNFTRITLAVGVAATGFQRLIFPTNGLAADSISLDLATPVGLTDLSVLGGVTVNVIKNNTIVRTLQLNSSLINLQLLSGNRFKATFLAGAEFDRVEVRFQALVAALSSLDIYGAKIVYPKPTITAQNQTICFNTSATLTAVANGGTQIKWFDAPIGGNELAITSPYNTPNLTTTTTYYIEVSRAGCASSDRIPLVVNVVPLLAVPTPASSNVVACSGAATTLSVANPVFGVVYRWFDAATNGNLLGSGVNFTATNITTDRTYYVEASQSGCVSSSRAAINVTVSARPLAPVLQASVNTVKVGQTAILTASSTESNVDFNWYSSRTASSPLYSGPTFVTPPLTANTSYYVETVSRTTGCASASRVMVTVNVDQTATPNPVPCISPVAQVNDISGIALLAGVSNENLAIDNEAETGSTLYLPVGALNAHVYQRLIFSEPSKVGDTVKVMLSSPGRQLSLGLLSSVQLGTYNGATFNNDLMLLSNSLIQLELLSGGSQALIKFVPTQIFDRIEVRLNGGIVSALSTVNVNYAQKIVTRPQVVSSNISVCLNATASLEVSNPDASYTYKWYDKDGNFLANGVTYTSAAITATTQFLVAAVSSGGCESGRTLVNVSVIAAPQVPILFADNISTCSGEDVEIEVRNPSADFTYNWYEQNSNTVMHTGSKLSLTNVTVGAVYEVIAVSTACGTQSSRTTATVTIGTLDAPILTATNVTITPNTSALLTASSSTPGAVINWYDDIAGVNLLGTGNSYLTDVLTADRVYYAAAVASGGCISALVPVTVTIAPNGTPGTVPCNTASINSGSGVVNLAILSGVFNPEFAVDNKTETSSSLVVGVAALGGYAYQRVEFANSSIIGDTVRVHISSPSKLLSLGVLSSISVLTYNGATSNVDELIVNNPLIKIDLLADGSAGVISFVPTKQFTAVELRLNAGIASALSSVNLNYVERAIETPQVTQAAISTCVGTSATLQVKNPKPNVTYRWFLNNTAVGDGESFALPTDLTVGVHNYFVKIISSGCESLPAKVVVTILAAPAKPVALAANVTTICYNSSTVLGVVAEPGLTYNWYNAAGDLLVQNNDVYTVPNNLAVGAYTYFVKAINATNCISSESAEITITVQRTGLATDIQVSGNTKICGGATILTASSSTVTNPVFKWFSDAALTVQVGAGATLNITGLTANQTYYVTVVGDEVCENFPADAKTVEVEINPNAIAADLTVSPSQEICGATSLTFTATSSTVVNPIFTWYTDANLTTVAFTGATFVTPSLNVNTTYYVTVKGDNKCENIAAEARKVTVVHREVSTLADISLTGTDKTCSATSLTITATSTTVVNPIFTWYADAALSSILYVGAAFNTGSLTQNVTYYVTVKGDNKCETLVGKPFTIQVNDYAVEADLAVTGTMDLCGFTSTTLTATASGVTNPVFTWYSNANLTNVVHIGAVFASPVLTANQTYYVTVKGDNKCENKVGTAKVVTITVRPNAVKSDIAAVTPITICGPNVASFRATTTTVVNPIFTWYSDAALQVPVASGAEFQTPILSANTKYYVTVKGDNKCENLPAEAVVVDVIFKPIALASDISISGGVIICTNGSTSLTASTTTVANPVFTWYSDAALTNKIYTGNVYTPTLSTTTTFYVTVKGDDKCENVAASVASVQVQAFDIPAAPTVETTGTIICINNSTVLSVQSPQPNVIYEWYGSANGGTLIHTGTTYPTGVLTTSVSYWVQTIGTLGCTTPSSRTKVDVSVNQVPASPTVVAPKVVACLNGDASLKVDNPQAGITYKWYAASVGGVAVFTGDTYTVSGLTANADFYVEASIGDCISTSRTMASIELVILPLAPISVTASNTQLCTGQGSVVTVNNPDANLVYRWYTTATGGTALYEGTVYTITQLSTSTTYYVESVVASAGCVSETRTAVTVNVSPVLQTPVVTAGLVTHQSAEFSWSPITGATSYEVSIDGGANWVSTTDAFYKVDNLAREQTVTLIVRALGAIGCQTSANSTPVTITTTNPFKDSLYVPNTFTPNGDGNNDIFYGYGTNVNTYRMRIFNQWGKIIFESLDVLKGWDGSSRGVDQPTGIYVYLIDVKYHSGVSKVYKGTVAVVR